MKPLLTELERYLFQTGGWRRMYTRLGAHAEAEGVRFAVWAPEVRSVSVSGEWNGWSNREDPLSQEEAGIWSGTVKGAKPGMLYKFVITAESGEVIFKSDPVAFWSELPPGTASRIAPVSEHVWQDEAWMKTRDHKGPMNIYEVHAGSWKRHEDGSYLTWDELREELVPYVKEMGYTHVEFLPLTEHPFDGSWGYQVTGFFSPTSRFGEPDGLRRLVDDFHRAGIGVILDWVPGHFCRNGNGLGRFNGKKLYEAVDHLQWGTYKFNYSRQEVCSFLLSSGVYWLKEFHFDGLRLDGMTSLLSLNFGTGEDQYRQNRFGGDADLDAEAFIRSLNAALGEEAPGAFTVAEESTPRTDVTKPVSEGGLGFDYKWNMGWMNDTLRYFKAPLDDRPKMHKYLTFPLTYGFSQRFVLPFSHDEVVHGKKTLLGRMKGSYEQQFESLRLLMVWQMLSPGKKLTFMGLELAPYLEWREQESLEWFMDQYDAHHQHREFIKALNRLYLEEPALHGDDLGWDGFQWLDCNGEDKGVISVARMAGNDVLVAAINLSPHDVPGYVFGVPVPGVYHQVFSTVFGAFPPVRRTAKIPAHGRSRSLAVNLPPLSAVIYRCRKTKKTGVTHVHR